MKSFSAIILFFSFTALQGQNKTINIPVKSSGDTTFWFNFQKQTANKIGVAGLDTSTFKESFRIWTNRQVIEILEKEDGSLVGGLTTWTDEQVPSDEKPTNRTFVKTYVFSADTMQQLKNIFAQSGILNLPSDDSIKGWKQGFDGIIYTVEYSTKTYYSFKTYWTPEAQGSLIQAKTVQNFVDTVLLLSNAGSI